MNSRRAGVIAILFILVLLALWLASTYLPAGSLSYPNNNAAAVAIVLKHSKNGNEHQYSGQAPIAAPCDALQSTLSVDYSSPPVAHISLHTESSTGAACAPKKSLADFSVSLMSEEVPQVSLTLDGMAVPVTVVEQ